MRNLFLLFLLGLFNPVFSQPANDNPNNAISITPSTSCSYATYTNANATATTCGTIAAPGCASYSGGDVWFSVVVPAGGSLIFDTQAGIVTDGGMAIYSGTACGTMNLIACDDDAGAGLMPKITNSTLTPGATIYIRFWEYGNNNNGTFGICVTEPPPPPPPGQGESCSMPNSFCSQPITYPAGTGGTVTAPVGPAYGCLGSQPNPAWFNMQVANSGNFTFGISAGSDIDFIIWGPFTSPTGACLAGLTAGNIVDCSFSGTANEVANIASAVAGDYYIIMITNYSGVAQNINFTQSGGVGLANCNILCNITGLTGTPGACQSATNTYNVTGTITTTSPPSSGTLTISSSCGGPPTILNPPFSTSTNYTLTGVPTTTGACTITAAYSADVSCTRTVTVNSPAPCGSCTMTASNTGPYCSGSTISLTTTAVAGATYAWSGPNGFTATGQSVTIPSATAVMGGVYSVTATAGPAVCSATTLVSVTATPTVSVNSPSICSGNSTTLTATGATTYSWSPATDLSATTGNSVIANPTTTTTYVVTGANGTCTSVTNSTVTVTPTPTVTVNSASICSGNSATLTANGATNYTWSPATNLSSTTSSVVVANPNTTTTYIVTGANGTCTSTANTTVTVTATPTLTVNSGSICTGDSVTLSINGAATYSWSPATGLSSVTDSVVVANPNSTTIYTITGNNGSCSSIINSTVTVSITPTVTVNSPTICAGQNAFLSAVGATTYVWSPATALSSTTGASVSSNSTSTIIYTVTGIDQGCSSSTTATVTVNPNPILNVNSASYCQGGSTTLSVTGASNYLWTPSTGLSSTTDSVVIANPTTTTIYTISGATSGCNAVGTATVTVFTNPTIDAGINDTVCLGNSTAVLASGAFSYVWNSDPSLSSTTIAGPTVTPTSTTTYFVTGTDVNGCIGTDNVTIVVPPTFTLTPTAIPATCFGAANGAASISAAPSSGSFASYSYSWNNGSTAQIINGLIAGTYNVVVRDFASCMQSASVTITQPTQLFINESSNSPVSCNGGNNGASTVIASGGTPAYTYFWSPIGTTAATNNTLTAGSYVVSATDVNGCVATTTVTITEPQAVSINNVNGNTICISQNTNLIATAVGGAGGYVYTWTDGTNTFNGNIINVSPSVTTSYTVSGIDANGCLATNTQSVTVNVNPPLSIYAIASSAICEGSFKNVDVGGNGGNGNHNFIWNPMTGVTFLNPNGSSVKLAPSATTNYTVSINDNCGTPAADTNFVLTINPKPVLTITPPVTSGCQPLEVNFTGGSSNVPVQCYWDFGDHSNSYNCNPTRTFAQDGTYNVSYNVIDLNGCSNSASSTVIVFPVPHAAFAASPQPTTIIDPEVTFTDITDANIVSQTWFFNDSVGTNSSLLTPSYIYPAPGEYFVTLAVETDKGCVDTTTQSVYISDYFVVYIPNAFSPDNDGYNDTFTAFGTGIVNFKMNIYDRWGGKILETNDINKGWDGKKSNEKVEKGVYVYRIEIVNFLGETKLFSGHVTVVR